MLKKENYKGYEITFGEVFNVDDKPQVKSISVCVRKENKILICDKFKTKKEGLEKAKDWVDNNSKSKKGIKLEKENTERYYKLSSPSTIYVRFNKTYTYDIDIDELIKKRNQTIKKLKSLGIKVKRKHNDDILLLKKVKFKEDIRERKKIEKEVILKFDKIYEEGLYIPTSDNKKLNEAIELSWKLDHFLYRSEPISLIREINSNINQIYNNENSYKNYEMMEI